MNYQALISVSLALSEALHIAFSLSEQVRIEFGEHCSIKNDHNVHKVHHVKSKVELIWHSDRELIRHLFSDFLGHLIYREALRPGTNGIYNKEAIVSNESEQLPNNSFILTM